MMHVTSLACGYFLCLGSWRPLCLPDCSMSFSQDTPPRTRLGIGSFFKPSSLVGCSSHTFKEAVVIHFSIDVDVLASRQWELSFRILIGAIKWVVTERADMKSLFDTKISEVTGDGTVYGLWNLVLEPGGCQTPSKFKKVPTQLISLKIRAHMICTPFRVIP